jgi:arylsulfatase A-like enzyme
VFIIMDSLRADRVRVFDPKARAEVPNWEKLAETSTVFAQNYVQGNESQVSHASMWTSMYLARHRAARWQHKLSDGLTTLDDVAAKAGLYPVGATGNGYIRPARGFGTEWRRYANHIEQHLGLRGDAIIAQGLTFLTGRAQEPWLLYLGLIDTHVPWRAKQPWLDRYSPDYRGRYAKVFGDDGGGGRELTEAEREHVRAIYDSNISYLDDQLGKLIAKLEAWGVWESTMLIVTADHGDELWEAGRVGHESGQDDTLLHVPLLVHYPPLFPGARVSVASEGVDLLPTIAEALGVVADPAWQGISLIPAAHGANSYPGIVSASGYERQHGARLGTWKLRLEGTRAPALFDLAIDPHELRDVFGAPGAIAAGRAVLDPISLLRAHHASWRKARWGNPGNVTPAYAADHGE